MITRFNKNKPKQRDFFSLLFLSLPLMLQILSENIMLFFDRLILAKYSLEVMNAATAASFFCCIFHYGTVAIVTVSEVIIGQYASFKKFKKTAEPTWQMIWFSLTTCLLFFPLALWSGPYLLSSYFYKEAGLPYFQWVMFFGPAFPLLAAFSSFFIGIGKTKLVTFTVLIGIITNIILDILFVFDFSPFMPFEGAKGAAIATGISQLVQIAILLYYFFSKYYREKYNTLNFSLKLKSFLRCFKMGMPLSVGYVLEMSSWAFIGILMAQMGEDYLTVMTVGQSLYSLVSFALDGMQRGISILTATILPKNGWKDIFNLWISGSKILFLFAIVTSTFMVFYPHLLIDQFLSQEQLQERYEEIASLLTITSFAIWLYILVDGLCSLSTGILIASGDTNFVLIAYSLYVWIFTFLPISLFVYVLQFSPVSMWFIVFFAAFLHAVISFKRVKRQRDLALHKANYESFVSVD